MTVEELKDLLTFIASPTPRLLDLFDIWYTIRFCLVQAKFVVVFQPRFAKKNNTRLLGKFIYWVEELTKNFPKRPDIIQSQKLIFDYRICCLS